MECDKAVVGRRRSRYCTARCAENGQRAAWRRYYWRTVAQRRAASLAHYHARKQGRAA